MISQSIHCVKYFYKVCCPQKFLRVLHRNVFFIALKCVTLKSVPLCVLQKEVEEERQARVGQVSELLGWVKGIQERAQVVGASHDRDPKSVESSLAAQQVQVALFATGDE